MVQYCCRCETKVKQDRRELASSFAPLQGRPMGNKAAPHLRDPGYATELIAMQGYSKGHGVAVPSDRGNQLYYNQLNN